jgi:hypothetical protein
MGMVSLAKITEIIPYQADVTGKQIGVCGAEIKAGRGLAGNRYNQAPCI